ncbi:NADPH-dependent 1-acyldihydroxyacetone phosphate reductase [Fimicolochytrium jonesii]|uniref:NADPH-dependent 1-acyldihydroxyacetone phosphate reductase n=1 Tax=Fimicolochytrium jonesii TaxID=1396493 RepID=UPI0022FDF6F8|nr:NADPH-dependent 1-acyldihydroxyacetone phosphate reductase [Fimicolochytrium jonesii]KAI8819644.1 NADPH-dependent 1-acyldihydroxyacetone phosphate reductase [Fimicolochytrium jonesii]
MTSKQTVLITGCSDGGIGHALAQRFHKGGYRVFATARRLEAMKDLAASGIETLVLDVTKADSVAAVLAEVTTRTNGKGLDYLINNAGQPFASPALDVDIDGAKAMFETNLWGTIRMNTAFQHLLLTAQGTIVHVGSVAGYIPFIFGAAYNASKAALHAYSNTLRLEVGPLGIKVMTIVTGGVGSNITSQSGYNIISPPGSLFAGVVQQVIAAKRNVVDTGMRTEVYAEKAFVQITGRGRWYQLWSKNARPAQIWLGARSVTIWLGSFFPVELFTKPQMRLFGLDRLLKADRQLKSKSE